MAKKKKRTQLSSEGKTELAKAIAEKSQTFAKTYANVEIRLSRVFRWISGWVDKLLFNQKHGKIVALMVAVLFYFGMSSDNSGLFENMKSAETLGEYKVSAVVSNQAYEVTGLDEMVKVRIIGDISDIKSVKQQKNFRVVANLTDLTEGTHEVKYTTEGAPSRVEVVLEPSNGIVTIKKKSIRSFTLGYDFVNRSNMDSIYDLGEPELEQGEVHVRASAETLDSIAYVKALIDVKKNYTSDFTTEAMIAAYDDKGNKMDVDIIPDKMNAHVKVSKPNKRVSLSIVPNGVIPANKAIESYKLNHDKVTVYAKQSVLDQIEVLPITIPASTLTSNRDFPMPIVPPNGVTKISESVVNISVKLADKKERVMNKVPIKIENGMDGFTFALANGTQQNASVTISGAKKVIDKVKIEDLHVYVDVSKIDKAGTYEQPLIVEGKNKLATYAVKNATVTIAVKEK